MDKDKVEKIQKVLIENPDLHVKLIESFGELIKKLSEKITGEELVSALSTTKTRCPGTYEEFWDHYK